MDKYIAWDKENNKVIYPVNADWENFFIEPDGRIYKAHEAQGYHLKDYCFDYEIFKSTGKTDIHGQEIYYDFHIVKFKYNSAFAIWIEHIGVFRYNEDELRGEIDISDQCDCICLWYDSSIMSNFEIIGNVKENPELIGEEGSD